MYMAATKVMLRPWFILPIIYLFYHFLSWIIGSIHSPLIHLFVARSFIRASPNDSLFYLSVYLPIIRTLIPRRSVCASRDHLSVYLLPRRSVCSSIQQQLRQSFSFATLHHRLHQKTYANKCFWKPRPRGIFCEKKKIMPKFPITICYCIKLFCWP